MHKSPGRPDLRQARDPFCSVRAQPGRPGGTSSTSLYALDRERNAMKVRLAIVGLGLVVSWGYSNAADQIRPSAGQQHLAQVNAPPAPASVMRESVSDKRES